MITSHIHCDRNPGRKFPQKVILRLREGLYSPRTLAKGSYLQNPCKEQASIAVAYNLRTQETETGETAASWLKLAGIHEFRVQPQCLNKVGTVKQDADTKFRPLHTWVQMCICTYKDVCIFPHANGICAGIHINPIYTQKDFLKDSYPQIDIW